MKFDPEDPKWTAYALDELDPAERARLEAQLLTDGHARRHVEEIRATARKVREALSMEPSASLTSAQRDAIHERAGGHPILHVLWRPLAVLGAAAGLVVGLGIALFCALPQGGRMARIMDGPTPPASEGIEVALVEQQEVAFEELGEIPEPAQDLAGAVMPAAAPPPAESAVDLSAAVAMVAEEAASIRADARLGVDGDGSDPLAMKGLFAGRATGGRGSVLSRNMVGYVRLERSRENTPSSGFLSPSQDDFDAIRENPFQRVTDHPLSTFSIDVDSASYAIVRRHLNDGRLPPKDAVRIEELVNYFPYTYEPPRDRHPIAVHLDAAACPWNPKHQLVRVALKARELDRAARPAVNLVFLVDVSGSMSGENRLPLVKRSLQALARQLDERDRLAIVVYAGAAGVVLPTTTGDRTPTILDAIERLEAGGSTAGGAGIQLAYDTARAQFVAGGVNRVILCTDGDFNVGLTQRGDLERLIEEKARSGVYLTALGFGMGNQKDSTLELLSGKGNGNHGYIDDFSEARRLLVDQMLGTLVAVAKDVKIQVEFNPARVAGYRLVGYENRMLRKEDFNNDRIDAGDVGAGHTVTAFYELVPAGQMVPGSVDVDPLKYQPDAPGTSAAGAEQRDTGELLTAKLRYKQPDGEVSTRMEFTLSASRLDLSAPTRDFRFASAVAAFGLILRDSPHRGAFTYADVLALAESDIGDDPGGYRREFLGLLRNAQALGTPPDRP